MFAGTTVVIALLALAVAGIPLVTSLGYASAVAVATAVLAAITLLPALLAILGHRRRLAPSARFLRAEAEGPGRGVLGRLGRFVTGKPWIAVAAAPADPGCR